MTRIVWVSRHPITPAQVEDLRARLGDEVEVAAAENTLWQASRDAEADAEANAKTWARISAGVQVVAGVFPPVALEALTDEYLLQLDAQVFTPVSEQTREERADGTAQTAFRHLRWCRLR